MHTGALEVSVLHSADKWFGMTYHEDREIVAGELRRLHAEGAYPEGFAGLKKLKVPLCRGTHQIGASAVHVFGAGKIDKI